MPVDSVSSSPYGFSTGATATAANQATTVQNLTEAEKAQKLLEAVNAGQKTDKTASKAGQDSLGKDDFMKLLIATLKYQDPSSPMDTEKLLEQTSVMTNMEQMIKMTEASQKMFEAQQRTTGSNLVGKTVVYDATDAAGNAVTTAGKVDAVEFLSGGDCLLHIGTTKIKMDQVLGVADPTEDSATDKAADTKATEKAEDTKAADKAESAAAAETAKASAPTVPNTAGAAADVTSGAAVSSTTPAPTDSSTEASAAAPSTAGTTPTAGASV